ncbi:MAG: carboxypeptidase regulatory-like domain-containing protein [Planctomycetes bacterium]|nr:carboxypeptidase regulatory-like domain-containing protein [Planctomycetota bacterium]
MSARRVLLALVAALLVLVVAMRAWFATLEPAPTQAGALPSVDASSDVGDERALLERESAAPLARRAPTQGPARRDGSAIVRGRVEDEHGAGIAGARVGFQRPVEAWSPPRGDLNELTELAGTRSVPGGRVDLRRFVHLGGDDDLAVVTDADGVFTSHALPAGAWRVVASAPEFDAAAVELGTLVEGEHRDGVRVRIARRPPVRIVATWPDGSASVGAEITIVSEPLRILAGQDAFVPPESSRPLDGARAGPGAPDPVGRTDARGAFEWSLASGVDWSIGARATRRIADEFGVAVPPEVRELVRGEELVWRGAASGPFPPPAEVRIALAPRPGVFARVTDTRGKPLERALVEVFQLPHDGAKPEERAYVFDEDRSTRRLADARTNDRGVAFFPDLDAARVVLVASLDGDHTSALAAVDATKVLARFDGVLHRASTLGGVVRDASGRPCAGVHVGFTWRGERRPSDAGDEPHGAWRRRAPSIVRQRATVTGEDGRFRIEQVQPGWARLVVLPTTGVPQEPIDLVVEVERDLLDLQLLVREGAAIEGRVLGPNGELLASRTVVCTREEPVTATSADNRPPALDAEPNSGRGRDAETADALPMVLTRSTTTDAGGVFRFEHLLPGRWTVRVEDARPGAAPAVASDTRELGEGALVRLELRLER